MHYLALIGLAIIIFLIGAGGVYVLRPSKTKGVAEGEKAKQKQKLNAIADDPGETTLWEVGQNRPIIDTQGMGIKFGRRTFFQKIAQGALISFAGWMAARGTNLLWAEKPGTDTTLGSQQPNFKKPVQIAQNSHSDDHHDSHNDDGHYDDNSHIDDHYDQGWHQSHNDYHTDREPHSDGHNDDNSHSDYHGDSGNATA